MYNKVELCGMNTAELPILSEQEKRDLLTRARAGDKEARQSMIEGNLRLVLSVVQRFSQRGENMDDLFQVGCIGLIKAIDNFDPAQQVRFSTYGVPMIIGEIRRFLRDNNALRVSRSLRDTAYRAMQSRETLEKQLGREPTMDEIAQSAGLTRREVTAALESVVEPISLDEPVYTDGGDAMYVIDQVRDPDGEDSWISGLQFRQTVAGLTPREKKIMELRYLQGKTQMEVAREIGISQAQVSRLEKAALERQYPRVGELPFDSARKMMTTLHRTPEGVVQYTKGAPDVVLKRCTHTWQQGRAVPLTADLRRRILDENRRMADRALRVLCAATRQYPSLPSARSPEALEQGLCYLGLVGMMDPVRPEAVEAIAACRQAGIRPVMITGDHRDTAAAIARQLGILEPEGEVLTGAQLSQMDDRALDDAVARCSVFARVQPKHKVRIVEAFHRQGAVTAMTGDGVNDAPAIQAADIGVGMGMTGTDVTKNVADMVLTDDNFATIVAAVEEGRRVYDNIRKSIQFLLSSNLAEVLTILVATLLGFTILEPVHLLWINLITDCFPALALGMERGEPEIMRRRPRDPKDGIFAGGMGFDVAWQGLLVTVVTLLAYFSGLLLTCPVQMDWAALVLSLIHI